MMKKFLFSQPDNVVLDDLSLTATQYRVYNQLVKLSNWETHEAQIKVPNLAELVGCSVRTIQYALKALNEKGIVSRVFRKSKYDPRVNISSLFLIHGRFAPCYCLPDSSIHGANIAPYGANNCTQITEPTVSEENPNKTLTRDEPEERLTPNYVESREALSAPNTGVYPAILCQDRAMHQRTAKSLQAPKTKNRNQG